MLNDKPEIIMVDPSSIVMCDLTLRDLQEAVYAWLVEARRQGWDASLEAAMMLTAGQIGLFRARHKAEVDAAVMGLISPGVAIPPPAAGNDPPAGSKAVTPGMQIETFLDWIKREIANPN